MSDPFRVNAPNLMLSVQVIIIMPWVIFPEIKMVESSPTIAQLGLPALGHLVLTGGFAPPISFRRIPKIVAAGLSMAFRSAGLAKIAIALAAGPVEFVAKSCLTRS